MQPQAGPRAAVAWSAAALCVGRLLLPSTTSSLKVRSRCDDCLLEPAPIRAHTELCLRVLAGSTSPAYRPRPHRRRPRRSTRLSSSPSSSRSSSPSSSLSSTTPPPLPPRSTALQEQHFWRARGRVARQRSVLKNRVLCVLGPNISSPAARFLRT